MLHFQKNHQSGHDTTTDDKAKRIKQAPNADNDQQRESYKQQEKLRKIEEKQSNNSKS